MQEYYYTKSSGERVGPKSEEELKTLIKGGSLDRSALCWTPKFGQQWKPVSETEIWSAATTLAGPPPLPVQAIGSLYAYLFAFLPLFGTIVEAGIDMNTSRPASPSFGRVILAYAIAYRQLAYLDGRRIKNSGNGVVAPSGWFWLAPMYLWLRARRLGERPIHLYVWCVAFILGLLFYQSDLKTGLFLGIAAPTCDSAVSSAEVTKIFAQIPLFRNDGTTALSIGSVKEMSFDEGARKCSAAVLATDGLTHTVTFDISKKNAEYFYYVNALD